MSDDSIIENTPQKKKIKTAKRKSKKIKVKFTEDNNSHLLSQLVAEFERNITQKSSTTNLNLGSNSETPSTSVSENDQKSTQGVKTYGEIIKQIRSEDPASSSSDVVCKNDQKDVKNEDPSSSASDFLCKNDQKGIICDTETIIQDHGPSTSKTIQKTYTLTDPIHSPLSKNSHKMYVFYLLDELVKFSANHFPKNCHVQLVGVLKLYEQDFFLISLEQVYWKSTKVKLNLRVLANRPDCDSRVTIFGVLTFDENDPIIVVQFFQPFTVSYNNFKKLMLRLRTTVPLENFEMVKNSEVDLSLNDDDNLSFDGELGDQTLANFLDEISFEKL